MRLFKERLTLILELAGAEGAGDPTPRPPADPFLGVRRLTTVARDRFTRVSAADPAGSRDCTGSA